MCYKNYQFRFLKQIMFNSHLSLLRTVQLFRKLSAQLNHYCKIMLLCESLLRGI